MATDDDEQNPFTRPGFITAAIVVALVAILGVVLAIVNGTRDTAADPPPATPEPTSTTSPTSSAPTADSAAASVCGLDGLEDGTARVTAAPTVDEWAYQNTTAFPISAQHGPAATDEDGGFRYCFQHTPEGALFAAAYILAAGSDPAVPTWIEYFAAPGPYRDALLEEPASGGESSSGTRLRLAGFRVLAYEGTSARVDLAIVISTGGQTATASFVYELVWADGDWKIDTSKPEPGNFSTIPNLTGYVPWGE